MKKKEARTPLIIFGGLLCTGPLWGMLGAAISMVMTFRAFAEDGPVQPETLTDNISLSLITTVIGLVAALLGIGVLIFAFACPRKIQIKTHSPPPLLDNE